MSFTADIIEGNVIMKKNLISAAVREKTLMLFSLIRKTLEAMQTLESTSNGETDTIISSVSMKGSNMLSNLPSSQ